MRRRHATISSRHASEGRAVRRGDLGAHPELTEEALRVMEGLAKAGMTMMLMTHEIDFARKVAHVTVFMHKGKVCKSGPSKRMFAAPQTPELRRFWRAA